MSADSGNHSGINRAEVAAMRRSYSDLGFSPNESPFIQFAEWLKAAADNPVIVEANAMVLSTVDGNQPSSRTVLLKDVTDRFTFFTNYNSRKGKEIERNSFVSLLFPWYAMERQVIVLGSAKKIDRNESEKYFATRPWSSQIGAWASHQSDDLSSREELENRFSEFASKFPEGSSVPTPPHWGGFEVVPTSIEFWQGRYSRLHDRIRYLPESVGTSESSKWTWKRINP